MKLSPSDMAYTKAEAATLTGQLTPAELMINPLLYQELKACANRILARHAGNITLQTTEVVHEACVKLIEADGQYQSKEHLFRTAAKAMRHLLIDYARAKTADKRGGKAIKTRWLDDLLSTEDENEGLIAVEQCISQISSLGDRMEAIVELHYFAGFSQQKVAETLQLSLRTVERELTFARAYIFDCLNRNVDAKHA
ncbi:ECF-type sigma factor [Shewanella cyperi]|uniref:ECF-type sigma factor n=1 Tax=Shewanella cyperi TaxID=2814292 RepID=UPI001A95257A|nr:ECF-type sigma factor [Shewanella cyperi]QSX41111.1 sigma-70 family RNA polymerase sigma factor [Shewanella cyperi]